VSDRLNELQRQRALAQEQVAWFDREIAKESGQTPGPTSSPAALPPPPAVIAPAAHADEATARAAQEIIAQYRANPQATATDVKKGCYLYFIFALGVFAICVVGIYIIYTQLR
jgi:hypothetical protein